jgi:hypothetical protein
MFRPVIAAACAALLLLLTSGLTPAGASSAAPPDNGYPEGTTLYPARLDRGADTPLLHTEGKVIVDRGIRVRVHVAGVGALWPLGRIGRDYLVETAETTYEGYAVHLVRRDGSRQVLQRFGQLTTPVVSADGEHLALVTPRRPNTRIRVVKTRTGELVREQTFASYGAEVSDYGIHRMVVTGVNNRTFWWNPETGRRKLIVARPAAADISANRLVVTVPNPDVKYEECQKTVKLSRPSVVLWRSCRDRPLAFSPDGRHMLTTYILSDGIGPGFVQVRREDGKLLRTLRPPTYFGFVEWESNRRVLLQPVGRKYVAAVRCGFAGECRRASRLYQAPAPFDPIDTMRWSFP